MRFGSMPVAINPPPAVLGSQNAILWGRTRGREHSVDYTGPLSLKTVVRGRADWSTDDGRFELDRSTCLVLNDGQAYSLAIEADTDVETFCVFFKKGLAGQVACAMTAASERLLGRPFDETEIGFFDRLQDKPRELGAVIARMHAAVAAGGVEPDWLQEQFLDLAAQLVAAREDVRRERARIPASRASTREELHRRLLRGKAFIDDCAGAALDLDCIAAEACLSSYHFHRLFSETFRETPHRYVRRRRLARAAALLESSGQPISFVCQQVGFVSVPSFTTAFKAYLGVTPAEYRRVSRRRISNPG